MEIDYGPTLARDNLLDFTLYTMPQFKHTWFHIAYFEILDQFANHNIKKLIVTVPPQHGKSEGSSRRLPAYILGHEPDNKITIASYSTPFARKFNRDVQRIIDSPEFHAVFPKTTLNRSQAVTVTSSELRNADEFEVVGHQGGLKAVGRGGALTGTQVDTLIIDDLYKDYMEGNSPTVLDNAWDWYVTVAETRLHNDSRQLIVFTRWNEADLVGRLENTDKVEELTGLLDEYDPDVWYKINFPAIREPANNSLDIRKVGEPLWPDKHSLKSLNVSKGREPELFQSLYQGNPRPREGLLYDSFSTYQDMPETKGIFNYTDTADTGSDFLCSINYAIGMDDRAYVTNLIYTDAPMEVTEPQTAGLLDMDEVSRAKVESNNGGRGFARKVQELIKGRTHVSWFHQSKNKEARIFTASAGIQRDILFPTDWAIRWPNFYSAMTGYRKKFTANKHDDGPDAVTGVYEALGGPSSPISLVRG